MSITPEQRQRAVVQIAMFTAAREAVTHGVVTDGIAHPTWDELGEMGQDAYLAESQSTVDAMVALGWEPRS